MGSAGRHLIVRAVTAAVAAWASGRPDIRAVALVGSWARHDARMDSDLDIVVLTRDPDAYVGTDGWVADAVGEPAPIVRTARWGVLTERRVRLTAGLEVEFGFAPPSWADTVPADHGTLAVVRDGCVALHDPDGLIGRLVAFAQHV